MSFINDWGPDIVMDPLVRLSKRIKSYIPRLLENLSPDLLCGGGWVYSYHHFSFRWFLDPLSGFVKDFPHTSTRNVLF